MATMKWLQRAHGRHMHAGTDVRSLAMLLLLVLLLLPALGLAQARPQATLDREVLRLGEVATLTIQTDQADAAPDYAPLERDFLIYAPTLRRQSVLANGHFVHQVQHAVGIEPRHAGMLLVPALRVGRQMTQPLQLQVTAADAPQAATAQPKLAFIRTRVDSPQPYVRQSVGVVVALYYATALASGELVQDAPQGTSLQRVANERTDQAVVDGQHYNVVERRYLLLPERSGPLVLPPARFTGRAAGGGFSGRMLSAVGEPLTLQVQPEPANAARPWLPLADLRLGYAQPVQQARVGQGLELVLEAELDGATRAQLDTLPLPAAGEGYRLYPQATEVEEMFVGERPQLRLRRRFSLVPERAGTLVLPAVSLAWWHAGEGSRRRTTQPALQLQVGPAQARVGGNARDDAGLSGAAPALPAAPARAVATRWWPWLATAFALAWLATLIWSLGRRRQQAPALARASAGVDGLAALRQQLASGSLQQVIDALRQMAPACAGPLDSDAALLSWLADAPQRQALQAAQLAWWGPAGGDRVAARERLRAAFADGPLWRAPQATPSAPAGGLPPLYPPG